jgi:hypothetical protein
MDAVAILDSAQQPPPADGRRRVRLEDFDPLIKIFEAMNSDVYRHLNLP